jgi:hypothetical protein
MEIGFNASEREPKPGTSSWALITLGLCWHVCCLSRKTVAKSPLASASASAKFVPWIACKDASQKSGALSG